MPRATYVRTHHTKKYEKKNTYFTINLSNPVGLCMGQ